MEEAPPGIRRVCIAVGLDQEPGQAARSAEFSARLRAAVVDACIASGLQRVLLAIQGDDDVQVALLPAGIDEPRAIAALTAGLSASLRKLNRHGLGGARLRVTMAVNEGVMTLEADGYRGFAITKACRLVNSEAVREALAAHRTADLIVLLSDRIFNDISELDTSGLPAGICRTRYEAPPHPQGHDAGSAPGHSARGGGNCPGSPHRSPDEHPLADPRRT